MVKTDSIVLAGGCFWCLDAIYRLQPGVVKVTSGYSGGKTVDPSYEAVCSGSTGHAQAVQIEFDTEVTTLDKVLALFWQAHDPTTPDRQGHDVGTQYRSGIYYNDGQLDTINNSVETVARPVWETVTTEIAPLEAFYPAEDHHQDYFNKNPNQPYCQAVISPKVAKFQGKNS